MRIFVGLSIILGMIFITGCQADALELAAPPDAAVGPTAASATVPESSDEEAATPDRIDPTVTKMPERVPPTEAIPPVTGEVPTDLLESIIKDLSERSGAAPSQIAVLRDQEVVWNDGSLGCPKPGEFYTQALVNGYWVVLEFSGIKYDYRATAAGYFVLCERGIPPGPPATPNS
jgi:hypothetical protein